MYYHQYFATSILFTEIQSSLADISSATNRLSINNRDTEHESATEGSRTDDNSNSDKRTTPVQNVGPDAMR